MKFVVEKIDGDDALQDSTLRCEALVNYGYFLKAGKPKNKDTVCYRRAIYSVYGGPFDPIGFYCKEHFNQFLNTVGFYGEIVMPVEKCPTCDQPLPKEGLSK